jgi:hypothetical protein
MKRLASLAVLAWLLALCLGCGGSTGPQSHASTARTYPKDHFVAGGIRTLAEGRVPHGPAFAISALRYRFQGKLYTDLQAQMQPRAKLSGASDSFSPRSREPFEWTAEQGCSAKPSVSWSILYGLLHDPGDRVVIFLGTHRRSGRRRSIPASFHLSGELGYAVLDRPPSRVLVLDRAGKGVQDQVLGSLARERCTPGESGSLMVGGGA